MIQSIVKDELKLTYTDPAEKQYRLQRIASWDKASQFKLNSKHPGIWYAKLLSEYYRFLIPEELKILEIGCAQGDLLSSLKPSFGVGIDFSFKMLKIAKRKHPDLHFICCDAHETCLNTKFDIIILSDLVINLWDVQTVFEKLHNFTCPETRIVINFPNNLWRLPMSIAKRFGLTVDYLEQNWFAPNDIFNLLNLSGFEVIKHNSQILIPFNIKWISNFINRFFANIVPFSWCALTSFTIARQEPGRNISAYTTAPSVSIIIPARNEAGNIENILNRMPELGSKTELIFVEGHSKDHTYNTIQDLIKKHPYKNICLLKQKGRGKGDAVRLGFEKAKGDILMILDADITVQPEDLSRFFNAIVSGRGEFINGVRLVYPVDNQAIRFFNMVGNKFFSLLFSWLIGQAVKDTLCGTKVLWRKDYLKISKNRHYFGEFDPFGDFDLLFGAAKLNLKIVDLPIRYHQRVYGKTNIKRWKHGWILLKMVFFAAFRIKFI